jgi:hypothetical protein
MGGKPEEFMNIGILSLRSTTAQALAESLGAINWTKHQRPPQNLNVLIRWGSRARAPYTNITFNKPENMVRASNKKLCRELLYNAGIDVPRITETSFPCIGRPDKHRAGKELYICHSPTDVYWAKEKGATYFSEFYPKTREYRIHVGHGRVILYSEKVGGDARRISWNYKEGEVTFKHLRQREWRPEIYRLAKRAVAELGLDFGAVDILADPIDEDFPIAVVCEVNTCPSLSPYGIKRYTKYFTEVLSGSW